MVNKVDQKEGGRLDAGCSLKHMFWMGHTGVFVFCGGGMSGSLGLAPALNISRLNLCLTCRRCCCSFKHKLMFV